jgi:hypothetical protein
VVVLRECSYGHPGSVPILSPRHDVHRTIFIQGDFKVPAHLLEQHVLGVVSYGNMPSTSRHLVCACVCVCVRAHGVCVRVRACSWCVCVCSWALNHFPIPKFVLTGV